jgi:hypothetical protein
MELTAVAVVLLQRRVSDAADAVTSSAAVKCDQQLVAKAKPADRSPQADSGDLPEPALDLLAGGSPVNADAADKVAAATEVRWHPCSLHLTATALQGCVQCLKAVRAAAVAG